MRGPTRNEPEGTGGGEGIVPAAGPADGAARGGSWWGGRAAVVVLVVVAMVAGAGLAVARTLLGGGPNGGPLRLDRSACGTPVGQLPAGRLTFGLTDSADVFVAVYLTDPDGARVYGEVTSIAPHQTLPLTTTLAAGHYAFRCVFSDGTVRTSRTLAVQGRTTGAVAGYRPMPDLALAGPVRAYRTWVATALPQLLTAARTLDSDVAHGDLAAARADWLPAHLAYERLGAAYNSFGDFDREIDGLADGLPQGVATPGWTGFHAIEYGLWHGRSAARLRPLTRELVTDIQALRRDFPSEDTDPGDLPLRAHEILENALQFQLTGIADYGSGTALATLGANVRGTREVLDTLRSLLRARDTGLLTAADQQLARVQSDLTKCRTSKGNWIPPARLDTARRQRLDADLGQLLERLAAVPQLLTARTSA